MKKFTYQILFVTCCLTLVLFALSCKKENLTGPRHLKGQVIDKTTGEGVGNAYVYLRSKRKLEDSERTIQAKMADSLGNFTFDFDYSGDSVYSVWAIKDGYYEGSISSTFVSPTKPNEFVKVSMQPEAYLRLHVKNTYPSNLTDKISISPVFGYSIDPLTGNQIDTTFFGVTSGNKFKSIYYWVTEQGVKTEYADTIFCPAHDTTDFEILY